MDMQVEKLNEVYLKIKCEDSIKRELSDSFSFYVEGYRFTPMFKNKMWDGKIRLYNISNSTLYVGLLSKLKEFAELRDYIIEVDPNLILKNIFDQEKFNSIKLPFEWRDYQINSIKYIAENNRGVIISPTGSGKSATIYGIINYYNKPTLLVVPTVGLVTQMKNDLISYGQNPEDIYCIYSGYNKENNKPIIISTWQSIYKQPKSWYDNFNVVIIDECHTVKAKSLKSILENMTNCPIRVGTTGTLDSIESNKLTINGLLGDIYTATSTYELMEKNNLAKLYIKCVMLKYNDEICKSSTKLTYQDEIKFLINNPQRNAYIAKIASSRKGNTILLFNQIEHGKLLYNLLKKLGTDVYLIYGGIDKDEREEIRLLLESRDNSILIGSYGTMSTGVNIKNVENIIFASPSKSMIRVLQSIGRGLRIGRNDYCNLIDISDNLSWKKHVNFTLKHSIDRMKIYDSQNFNYKFYKLDLK